MTFSFAFELSPLELTEITSRNRRGPLFHWGSTAVELGWGLLFLGTAVAGTLGWMMRPTLRWYDVGSALLGWTYIALAVIPAVVRRVTNALAPTYGVATATTVTVDARGVIEVIPPSKHEQWGWDELRNVRSDRDGVTLEFRDGKACWIPVRAFGRTVTRATFVEYADRMRRPEMIVEQQLPEPNLPVITIPSGAWRWETKASSPGRAPHALILVDATDERNRLTVDLEESDVVSDETIGALTRNPSHREWVGEDGVKWRIGFPQDDMANAAPVHWPAGMVELPRVVWFRPGDTDTADTQGAANAVNAMDSANAADSVHGTGAPNTLPWTGLGHVTHAELLQWFNAQRTRLPQSQTADAE